MDKYSALETVRRAGMTTSDIANSIYLATVEGISGANQNDGYGFALSALAELWNIRGTITNPNGRTKITNRYKGMGVTYDMIYDIISEYPEGFDEYMPTFDSMLGIGSVRKSTNRVKVSRNELPEASSGNVSNADFIVAFASFVILKFFLGWGWLISFILAMIIASIFDVIRRR